LLKITGYRDANEVKNILKAILPLLIVELFESILSVTDTYFVSGLGSQAVAAVGFSGYILWVFNMTIFVFFIGVMVLLSQAYGAKNYELCSRIVGENLPAAGLFGLTISMIVLLVLNPIITYLGGNLSDETKNLAINYTTIRLYGLTIMALTITLDASIRAAGFNKYLLFSYTTSVILNIILDPILIYGYLGLPSMGVKGAALATVLSQTVGLFLLFVYIKKLPFRVKACYPGRIVVKTLRVGFPGMIERMVFSLGNLAYANVISRCGDIAMASHTIGLRIESFVFTPLFAFSTVSTSMVGQSVGKGDINEAYHKGFLIAKLSVMLMFILGGILLVLSPIAPKVFTDNVDVARLATIYLFLAGISEPFLGLAMTLSSSIRGAGNTLVPMIINITLLLTIRVFLAYILIENAVFQPLVIGAWIGMFLDVFARGIVFLFIYKRFFHKLAKKLV